MLVQHRCRAVGHSDVRVDVIVQLLLLEVLPEVDDEVGTVGR